MFSNSGKINKKELEELKDKKKEVSSNLNILPNDNRTFTTFGYLFWFSPLIFLICVFIVAGSGGVGLEGIIFSAILFIIINILIFRTFTTHKQRKSLELELNEISKITEEKQTLQKSLKNKFE